MKKYVITDPCYLMNRENQEKYFRALEEKGQNPAACNDLLSELLGTRAQAEHTGYGDWGNRLEYLAGDGCIISSEFCADSGMVCCCELTPELEAVLSRRRSEHGAMRYLREMMQNLTSAGRIRNGL